MAGLQCRLRVGVADQHAMSQHPQRVIDNTARLVKNEIQLFKYKCPIIYICQFIVYFFLGLNLCDFSAGAPVYGKKGEGVDAGEETDDEEDKARTPPEVSRPGGD